MPQLIKLSKLMMQIKHTLKIEEGFVKMKTEIPHHEN